MPVEAANVFLLITQLKSLLNICSNQRNVEFSRNDCDEKPEGDGGEEQHSPRPRQDPPSRPSEAATLEGTE